MPSGLTARCCSKPSRKPRSTRKPGGLGLGQSDAEVDALDLQRSRTSGDRTASSTRQRFQSLIRQFGYTEQRYLAEQRRVVLRRQIAGTISAGFEPPKSLIDALIRFQNEQRSIEYVKLDAAQAGTIDPAVAGDACRLFRRAQDPVPRARIPQDLLCRDHAGRDRQMDRGVRRGRQEGIRAAPRQARHAGKARGLADRVSERRGSARGPRPHHLWHVVRRSRQGAQSQCWPTSTSA